MSTPRLHLHRFSILALGVLLGACDGATAPDPGPSAVEITAAPQVLFAGYSSQLAAAARDEDGDTRSDPVTWTSSDPRLARVSATGLLEGVAPGRVTLTATAGPRSVEAVVEIMAAPPHPVLAVGPRHACAIATDGAAYCWGQNNFGQLGDGTTNTSDVPVRVAANVSFVAVGAGQAHSCGLTSEGVVYCWGSADAGVLGRPGVMAPCAGDFRYLCGKLPQPVAGDRRYARLSVRWNHACALTADGEAYCWGSNGDLQLGAAVPGPPCSTSSSRNGVACSPEPLRVQGETRFADVSTGTYTTCGLTAEGVAHCWGYGGRTVHESRYSEIALWNRELCGVLPAGSTRCASAGGAFATLAGDPGLRMVSLFWDGGCGLGADARAYCWGSNDRGGLGDGTLASRAAAAPVAGSIAFASVRTIGYFSCGISVDGVAYCWGWTEGIARVEAAAQGCCVVAPARLVTPIRFRTNL